MALAALCGVLALPAVEAAAPVAVPLGRIEQAGMVAEIAVAHLDPARAAAGGPFAQGDRVVVTVTLTYGDSGEPVTGASPAVWMSRTGGGGPDTTACRKRVELYAGGSLFSRAEVDLNVFYVVTLNHDGTLAVVDPLFGFGGSKLLALVPLDGVGEDWVRAGDRILVSLPDRGEVVAVDTRTWQVAERHRVGGRPARLLLSADRRLLWIGVEGGKEGGLVVLAVESGEVLARFATGGGRHDLALDHRERHLFMTDLEAGTVAVVDTGRLSLLATVATGREPVSVAWSALAGRAYVAHRDGRVAVLSPEREGWLAAVIEGEPGLAQLRFSPSGRFGFALNPERDLIHIIDPIRDRIVQSGDFPGGPDQVTFTDELAYLRHRDHETVMMIPLAALGQEGEPVQAVDFPGGERPLGAGAGAVRAASITRAPGGTAVLVANPADRAVYYYREGMAAPMGSFRVHGREPRAVLVVDRSLRESAPGRYETTVELGEPGHYEAALLLPSPLLVGCLTLDVAAAPGGSVPPRTVRLEVVEEPFAAAAGSPVRLRFRLLEEPAGRPLAGLSDVVIVAIKPPGTWHQRLAAEPAAAGTYEAAFTPPAAGTYVVHVESASAGMGLRQAAVRVEVGGEAVP